MELYCHRGWMLTFVEKYVSSKTNPFALISETCMYDDSVSWADMDELFGSLHQIEWL